MKRRTFIAALGCAAAGWPFAGARTAGSPHRRICSPFSADDSKPLLAAFEGGLAILAMSPARRSRSSTASADGQEDRMAVLARELVNLNVDVIVTGAAGVYAAHRVNEDRSDRRRRGWRARGGWPCREFSAIPVAMSPERPTYFPSCW